MKRIVEETGADGLEKMLGEQVLLMCAAYFYAGKLVGVNDACVVLKNPSIVYETGSWLESGWKDAQELPCDELVVMTGHIESCGVMPC